MNVDELNRFFRAEFPESNLTVEAVGDRSSRVRKGIDRRHLRPGGTVSGPTLFALADAALYGALLGELGHVPLAVTTDMSIHFLRRPKADADIVAECRLLKLGRTLAIGDVTVFSVGDERPVAHAVGTYAIPPEARQSGSGSD